jgi:hypothetical protein
LRLKYWLLIQLRGFSGTLSVAGPCEGNRRSP